MNPDLSENGYYVSLFLAYRPHVNGVFGHQKRKFSKTDIFECDDVTDRVQYNGGALRMLCKGRYSISIAVAFSGGRAKTIRIRCGWTCIVKSPFSKISGHVLINCVKVLLGALICFCVR